MVGSSQMSSEPRDFSASLYVFQLVVRYFCGAGFIRSGYQTSRFLADQDLVCATKPVELIREAQAMGSRLEPACIELGITLRTFQRWVREGDDAVAGDSRRTSVRPGPANKLSEDE